MLVLKRKVGERIIIGEGATKIVLTILPRDGRDKYCLGFEGARGVKIDREEVANAKATAEGKS